ncbi:MAG: phosphoribosyl-ATP diphosphatase [Alphaproteobacteria bacterium]
MRASFSHILDDLYRIILDRKTANPTTSRTARLFAKGPKKIAQKVGEEAVEVALEGEKGSLDDLAGESADLIYHLLVLWASRGLAPETVWARLKERRISSSNDKEK